MKKTIAIVALLLVVVAATGMLHYATVHCPIDNSVAYFTGTTKVDVSGKELWLYKCDMYGHEFWVVH